MSDDPIVQAQHAEYGVRWQQVKRGEIVTLEKVFNSSEKRDRFAKKLPNRAGFVQVTAWLGD